MKTLLKQFQEGAVDQFVDMLHEAAGSISKMKVPQAVVLTAPTGSGKTVIAAAAIESLLDGDAKHAKDAQATVLWITDQPDLNEQTRRKMLQHSTSLTPARLETDFHQQTFDPGKVYFLNTQKLGKNSSLVQKGNDRVVA